MEFALHSQTGRIDSEMAFVARRYDTGEPVRIALCRDRIASVAPAWPRACLSELPFIAPGMFDLQVNGFGGVSFADRALTAEKATEAIGAYLAHGVTRLCPTLITASFEMLSAGFAAIRRACETHAWVDRMVAGCHLEGPYLSPEDGPRGAHPRKHIRAADWEEFCELQRVSGGRIGLVTIAPETPHGVEFIRRTAETGVRVAIGHTAASAAQLNAAVRAGATLSTHLGNGSHMVLPRHPHYIWDQLGDSRLAASLIADGQHLPDCVLRAMIAAKSPARSIITCDASGWAGCPPGRYEDDLGPVDVLPGGRIVVAGQNEVLAGSWGTTELCVAHTVQCGAASLRDALDMACRSPARLLGKPEGRLMAGDPADLFLFQWDRDRSQLEVQATLLGGTVRAGRVPAE